MGKEVKKMTLTIEIQENNTPQSWEFKNINGIEQVYLWTILKKLCEKELNKLIGN